MCVGWVRTFWRFGNPANGILPTFGTSRPLPQVGEQLRFGDGCTVCHFLIGGKFNFRAVNHSEVGDAAGLGPAVAPGNCQCGKRDCDS